MAEVLPTDRPPYGAYPFMFGGTVLSPELAEVHRMNMAFAGRMVLPEDATYEPTELDRLAIATCATALTSTDHRLGRDTAGLGTLSTEDEDGFWQYYAMPTFYHNGDGTRLAMLGTRSYMDYIDQIEDTASPYRDRRTHLATMLTAAYDDLVFGGHGRGGDETQSARLARTHMLIQGFPRDMVEEVVIGIEASRFTEATGSQNYDPSRGAEPVQRGSLVGDLWAIGTPKGPANTFFLIVENLWKWDLVKIHGQILRTRALVQAVTTAGWQANTLTDFLEFAQTQADVVDAFGNALMGNRKFLLDPDRFVDPRITMLMRPALLQNARLQYLLGAATKQRILTITEAFHCAVSYADGHSWLNGERQTAALDDYTPEKISELLLTEPSIETIKRPVDAISFFASFMAERHR